MSDSVPWTAPARNQRGSGDVPGFEFFGRRSLLRVFAGKAHNTLSMTHFDGLKKVEKLRKNEMKETYYTSRYTVKISSIWNPLKYMYLQVVQVVENQLPSAGTECYLITTL